MVEEGGQVHANVRALQRSREDQRERRARRAIVLLIVVGLIGIGYVLVRM